MLRSHHEETRELLRERDNARNKARCTQARKTTRSLDGQHQDVDRTHHGRVTSAHVYTKKQDLQHYESIRWQRTEINGESTFVHSVANPRIDDG